MQPTAFIIGMDLNGLGVLRSLAPQGIDCICIDSDPSMPGMHSRFGRKVRFSTLSGPAFIDELIALAQAQPTPPVLFLTQEASVTSVSEARAKIAPVCRLRLPDHDMLMALMDKDRFHQLAVAHDAPLPRSCTLHAEGDLQQLTQLRFPCVLKPAYKDYGYGARFKKAYVVQDAAEAERIYREVAPTLADMVVQEWIEGEDSDIYFCLQYRARPDRSEASFVGRKIRSWPPRVGGTASCTVAREHIDEAIRHTDDFFHATGFVGMGGIEYKFDRPSGRLLMIEPTVARTDMQHEVATLNGVNLPWLQYCIEAGLSWLGPSHSTAPVIWREPVVDAWSEQTLRQSPVSLDGYRTADAFWRWNDPGPGLNTEVISERLKATLKRMLA